MSKDDADQIIDFLNDSVIVLDEKTKIKKVNPYTCALLGYKEDELLDNPITMILMNGESSYAEIKFKNIIEQGELKNYETYYTAKDGKRIRMILNSLLIKEEKNNINEIACIGRDITDIRIVETSLIRLASIPEDSPEPFIEFDLAGKMTYCNPIALIQFPDISEQRFEHPVLQGLSLIISAFNDGQYEPLLREVTYNNHIYEQKICYVFESDLIRIYMDDITKLKLVERELSKAKEYAENISRAKSEFLANMSHELRTPLNAIIGFTEILQEESLGGLSVKQKEYLQDIWESSHHILSLINDSLDIAKIEAGKIELKLSEFDLIDVIRNSIVMMETIANKHNINFILDVRENIGLITADERRIRQIMFNLLSNAVKFTPDGGKIGVEVKRRDKEIFITIWDTGIGIEDKDKENVFKEFAQIENVYPRQHIGTGLGLSLTKKLIELHGGTIWFESEGENKGTRFNFTLPLTGDNRRGTRDEGRRTT